MAQVSVADVDNLMDIFSALSSSYTLAKDAFDRDLAELERLHEKAERDCIEANQNLEIVESNIVDLEQQLAEKEQELSNAEAELEEARESLAEAESSIDYE